MMRFVIILVVLTSFKASSQDVHFSQFYETKALINPALVGYQYGDYKVQMQRKSQWESVSIPFNTFSIAFEAKEFVKAISIGIQFLNDISGDSKFRTNGFNIIAAKKTSLTQPIIFHSVFCLDHTNELLIFQLWFLMIMRLFLIRILILSI